MKHILWTLCLAFLAAATAAADDVRPVPLVLYPAAAPSPALKYTLLPELRDAIPGNAADHYRRAIKLLKQDGPPEKGRAERIDAWMKVPLKDFPREEVGKFLKQCETTFQEVDTGARSEDCDWGLTEELRKQGINVQFTDLQGMRSVASLLTLRVRYELAEGRPDKAARTLRTGFAVARHVAESPGLIPSLTGMTVAALMIDRMEEFVQQPDAPNMYWPLTDLPRPFVDLHKPWQGERVMVYGTFPGAAEMAADLNAKPWTAEHVKKIVALFETAGGERTEETKKMALRLAAEYEADKKALIAQGRPKELVDAMPHVQVGLLIGLQEYDRLFDDGIRWESLPFWEAMPGLDQWDQQVRKEAPLDPAKGRTAIPIANNFLPAAARITANRVRLDRRIAALRCVEAVRLYAAAHDGKLPASLDDIKEVPLPPDPVNGKPFDYRVSGDRAFLRCPPFPGLPEHNSYSPTYELSIKR